MLPAQDALFGQFIVLLVDKQGIIRVKLFYEGYAKRHTSLELIEAAKGVR